MEKIITIGKGFVTDLIDSLLGLVDSNILSELAATRESGIDYTFSINDFNIWLKKYGNIYINDYEKTINEQVEWMIEYDSYMKYGTEMKKYWESGTKK